MIAFHFKTKFKHHHDGVSSVKLTYKRGPNGWDEVEDIENTWIDDDGKNSLDQEFKILTKEHKSCTVTNTIYVFLFQSANFTSILNPLLLITGGKFAKTFTDPD